MPNFFSVNWYKWILYDGVSVARHEFKIHNELVNNIDIEMSKKKAIASTTFKHMI